MIQVILQKYLYTETSKFDTLEEALRHARMLSYIHYGVEGELINSDACILIKK